MSVATGPDGIAAVERILPLGPLERERLAAYVALLRQWQPVKNLVSPATLPEVWRRHVADSAQAHLALPDAVRWVDLGSGAGFPGLVTAVLVAERPGAKVHLVESNGRKAAFLRTVGRELGLPIVVHAERIEAFAERFPAPGGIEAVSARALAGLDSLLRLAEAFLAAGAVGVFHKGQDFAAEVAEATQSWVFDLVERESRTGAGGRIAVIRKLRRK